MIRWILAGAFYRWGLVGLVCALFFLALAGWWLITTLWWLIAGTVYVFGVVAMIVYGSLLIAAIRGFRGRRRRDHLLSYGRRQWWAD